MKPKSATPPRRHYYRHEAEPGSLCSADYNQQVLVGLYRRLTGSRVRLICDVGSGTGKNLALLRQLFPGARILAVDLSASGLELGCKSQEGVSPAVSDALCLPLRDRVLDLAVCTEVLEHMEALDRAAAELARVVRPAGHCVISSPNYLNPIGVRKWWKDRKLGKEYWDPWDGHPGFERLMLPGLVRRAFAPFFRIRAVRGAGFLMAWSALGYRRAGRLNDRYPGLVLGRLPVLKNLALNRYLLLERRSSGNE